MNKERKITWIDREKSWLEFNDRVLLQHKRTDMPISERIKFIGIAASNLIEFISVRFGACMMQRNKRYVSALRDEIIKQKESIHKTFEGVNQKLCVFKPINEGSRELLDTIFRKNIYPLITPIAVGTNKEVPIFNEKDVNFFIELHHKNDDDKKFYCFLQIPHQLSRLFSVKKQKYLVEDIVEMHLKNIFNNMVIDNYVLFTTYNFAEDVDKNADIPILTRVNKILDKRRSNNFTFIDIMTYNKNKGGSIIKKLVKLLNIPKSNIFCTNKTPYSTLGLHFVQSVKIKSKEGVDLSQVFNSEFKPNKDVLNGEKSVYKRLDKDGDLVLHHPYDSYEPVISFIKEASTDPNVISIKQTLYRVSSEKSPIVKALCDASERGIQVTVMIELLARFDERRNISLIKALKKAGVNIVYSLEGIKTHCKMCLVVKTNKHGELNTYAHMSTGNYNESTAKVYTDISYFTAKPRICSELNSVFNMISGFGTPVGETKYVSYSPFTLRNEIIKNMKWVVKQPNSKTDKKIIGIKCNSISDREMVKEILRIADEHPEIEFQIIVRGICSLPPRKNIKIKSIVGRFLEHSRIYTFRAGNKVKTFISSADLLTRNLDRRIELLVEITDKTIRKKVTKLFKDAWNDVSNTYWLDEDTVEWYYRSPKADKNAFNVQDTLTRHNKRG